MRTFSYPEFHVCSLVLPGKRPGRDRISIRVAGQNARKGGTIVVPPHEITAGSYSHARAPPVGAVGRKGIPGEGWMLLGPVEGRNPSQFP